jgi:hypothetical protein
MKIIIICISILCSVLTFNKNIAIGQCFKTGNWLSQGYEDPKTGQTMYLPTIIEFKSDTITIKNANIKFSKQRVDYLVLNQKCDWDVIV